MADLSYYEILQVSPEATEDAIRAAYFRLAKIYHPDLRRQDQRPEDTEKFIEINRAYTILTDQAKRQVYDLDLQRQEHAGPSVATATVAPRGQPQAPRAESAAPAPGGTKEAGRAFMKAEQLVEEGRFKDAARVMMAIVRLESDNAAYLSLAGYAMAAAGENLHKARDLCRRAAESEPYNATFQARLAFVYETAGLDKLAERFYRDALRIDPLQPLARQRAGGAGQPHRGGLLAGLRGLISR
ncbi:MAG: J domain-containing protein [Candidatus Krumholzibacteriia bacterium]